ncbi:hypothetical protein BGW36DRAFT_321893, partial [Talaromyces proteolyticus]
MESEKILLLGATGGSGIAFIEESLALPHPPHLTLYLRNPSKLPPKFHSHVNISIVTGTLSDFDALASTMKTHAITTVVSFLGAYVSLTAVFTRPTHITPIADSFTAIMRAMAANSVPRLLVLSTPAYWVDGRDVDSSWKLSLFGLFPKIFAPQGSAEMKRIAENVVNFHSPSSSNENGLEWTVFRIPALTDGSGDLPVWAGYAGPEYKGGLYLSRASLARWVLG